MALTFGDNISYQGKKPLDARFLFSTKAAMKAYSENYLPPLAFCQNEEDGKFYVYDVKNDVDATLGKWRELSSGGAKISEDDDNAIVEGTDGGIYVSEVLVVDDSSDLDGKTFDLAVVKNGSVDINAKNNVYSTDERIVGYFEKEDGSVVPLYRKIIRTTTGSTASTTINIPITDATCIVNMSCILNYNNNGGVISNSIYFSSSDYAYIWANANNNIVFRTTNTNKPLTIIAEYIKD